MKNATVTDISTNVRAALWFLSGASVFFMQAGYAFLEAGAVQSKNTPNIFFRNTLNTLGGSLVFWAVGYSFSGSGNQFIGTENFFLDDAHGLAAIKWFVFYVFTMTSATVVTGAMAERTRHFGTLIFSLFFSGFLQPVVMHWTWNDDGWLKHGVDGFDNATISYKDFAGSSTIFVVGGTAALIGAAIIGPRPGRFDEYGKPVKIEKLAESSTLSTLGCYIILYGFFAFNFSSHVDITDPMAASVLGHIAANTALAGASGGLTSLLVRRFVERHETTSWSLETTLRGSLAGIVSVGAGVDSIHTYSAVIISAGAGWIYVIMSRNLLKVRVDDPLETTAIHLGGGFWGVLTVSLFDMKKGFFYETNTNGLTLIGWNLCGLLVITVWTLLLSGLVFGILFCLNLLQDTNVTERQAIKRAGTVYSRQQFAAARNRTQIERDTQRLSRDGVRHSISVLPLSMMAKLDNEESNTTPNHVPAEDNSTTIHNAGADITSVV